MSAVRLKNVSKTYGSVVAVRDFDLEIRKGEFVTLLGASGSGKTTCLRMVAGFARPSAGQIFIGEQDVTRLPARRRNAGMVFQSYALFPHLTVAQNVAFGLKVRRIEKRTREARTLEALRLVHMEALAGRYPAQLSGGQRQRVALARAVVIKPDILLLDEPLAALDLKLREELQDEIKEVQTALGITTLFVTHDQKEALSLSDRVVVMRDGIILQVDTPEGLYQRPRTRYVADFVGGTNLVEAVVAARSEDGQRYSVEFTQLCQRAVTVAMHVGDEFTVGESCWVGFRPEVAVFGNQYDNSIDVSVRKIAYVGEWWVVDCDHAGGNSIVVKVSMTSATPRPSSNVPVSWPSEQTLLLKREQNSGSRKE